jgi:hypothetical protein
MGSPDALGDDDGLVLAEFEAALDLDTEEDDSLMEALADDLVEVENDTIEDAIEDALLDAEAGEDCAALLGTEYDTEGVACGDCDTLVGRGHCHSLCVGVACAPVVCGGAGRVAVPGPNSFIK